MSLSASKYSPPAWLQQLQALLPSGLAWRTDARAVLTHFLAGIAIELSRIDGRAEDLLEELDPAQTVELLEEWVVSTGIRECFPRSASAATVARELGNPGGQSIAYFTQRALDLGYVITIEELAPFVVGTGRMGHRLNADESRFAWKVITPGTPDKPFRMGMRMGDSLRERFQKDLECPFEAEKPAHTRIIFEYTS